METPPPLLVHLALAGGGAKGFAHVSFMRAINWIQSNKDYISIQIMGFAGTSAGAIAASLFAAGYKPDELLDPETGKSPALESIGIKHIGEMLGPTGRRDINRLRFLRSFVKSPIRVALIIVLLSLLLLTALYALLSYLHPAIVLFLALIALLVVPRLIRHAFRGIWSTEHLQNNINTLLARKLNLSNDAPVLFRHLTSFPLRILATNITTGEARVFSNDRFDRDSRDVAVASAVAASVAIPIVFRPVKIGSDLFCDGGLISNLPVWTFARDTLSTPHSMVFAVNFPSYITRDDRRRVRIDSPMVMLWHILNATAFGDPAMERNAGACVLTCDLEMSLKTLDFDLLSEDLLELHKDASAAATLAIASAATYFATGWQLCKALHDMFQTRLHRSDANSRIRVVIMEPVAFRGDALRVVHAYNIADDIDAASLIPPKNTIESQALASGQPILVLRDQPLSTRHSFRWAEARWAWVVPLALNGYTETLIRIDSNICPHQLGLDNLHQDDKNAIEEIMRDTLQKLLDTKLSLHISGSNLPTKEP